MRQGLPDRDRPPVRRQCLGRMAGVVKHDAKVMAARGQVALVVGYGRVVVRQPFLNLKRLLVRFDRFDVTAHSVQQNSDAIVASGQIALVFASGRVVTRELIADRERPTVRLQRLGRLTRFAQSRADVVVALGQIALILVDGRGTVRQPFPDRLRSSVRRQCLCQTSRLVEHHADGVLAFAQFGLILNDGRVVACHLLQNIARLDIRAQGVGTAADLACGASQVIVRARELGHHFGPRVAVGHKLIAQLVEELERLLQECLAQWIQLATVFQFGIRLNCVAKLSNRVDGQRLPLLGPQSLVGELSVLSCQHRGEARQARQTEYEHCRRAGHQRPMTPHKPPHPSRQRFGVSRHGLASQPAPHVLSHVERRRVSILRILGHRLRADRLQCVGHAGLDLARRSELTSLHLI